MMGICSPHGEFTQGISLERSDSGRRHSAGCHSPGTNLFLHFLDVSGGILMALDFFMPLAKRLPFGRLGDLQIARQGEVRRGSTPFRFMERAGVIQLLSRTPEHF
jgi:hypothetical protein